MNISEQDVTIHLQHELDLEGEYNCMHSVDVDILVRDKAAGKIKGTMVHRSSIPESGLYSVVDGHSAELQYVALNLFEPRYGRTRLRSLLDGLEESVNEVEHGFLYISSLQVNTEYTTSDETSSNVGTYALRKLLQHPYISGRIGHITGGGEWHGTGSCCYILDTTSPKDQNFAIQFLRNGFFQDGALVNDGGNRLLVAARDHWTNKPLKSHADAAAMRFLQAPSKEPPPRGKDGEIRQIIERECECESSWNNDSSYQTEIARLIGQGGSLTRARALHVACMNQNTSMVQFIIQADPATLESRDETLTTPLMIAASSAVACANMHMGGMFPRDQPVIDILLAAGARKDVVSSTGMTAYGYMMKMQAMTGAPVVRGASNTNSPGLDSLKTKLMPPGGPTTADLNGGITVGFVDYSEIDAQSTRYEYIDDVRR